MKKNLTATFLIVALSAIPLMAQNKPTDTAIPQKGIKELAMATGKILGELIKRDTLPVVSETELEEFVKENEAENKAKTEQANITNFNKRYNALVDILATETFNLTNYFEQRYAGQRILCAVVDLAQALNNLPNGQKEYQTIALKTKLFKLQTTQGASIVNIAYLYTLGIRLSSPNQSVVAEVDNSPIFAVRSINESLKEQESILKAIKDSVIDNKDSVYSEQYVDLDWRYSSFLAEMEKEEEERTLLNVYDRLNALARALNALPKEDKELYTQKIGSASYVFVAEHEIVNISWLTKHVKGTYGINYYEKSPIVNSELAKYPPKAKQLK
ncbi:MAG: hypothetical protein K6E94_03540 [Elusimicrobiaceae bacterium]|nr:hypothetical protein [Elusimicrobiaceae bacterium]